MHIIIAKLLYSLSNSEKPAAVKRKQGHLSDSLYHWIVLTVLFQCILDFDWDILNISCGKITWPWSSPSFQKHYASRLVQLYISLSNLRIYFHLPDKLTQIQLKSQTDWYHNYSNIWWKKWIYIISLSNTAN